MYIGLNNDLDNSITCIKFKFSTVNIQQRENYR